MEQKLNLKYEKEINVFCIEMGILIVGAVRTSKYAEKIRAFRRRILRRECLLR